MQSWIVGKMDIIMVRLLTILLSKLRNYADTACTILPLL